MPVIEMAGFAASPSSSPAEQLRKGDGRAY